MKPNASGLQHQYTPTVEGDTPLPSLSQLPATFMRLTKMDPTVLAP